MSSYSSKRSRSGSRRPPAAVVPDDVEVPVDPAIPGPSTSGTLPRLDIFDFSSGEESEDEYQPRRGDMDSSSSEDEFEEICSEDELDYVSQQDSTFDSDEPLSLWRQSLWQKNAPGQPKFVWKKRENVPRRYGFNADPGVKADLDGESTPLDIFRCFVTDDLVAHIVRETNRYAGQSPRSRYSHERKWTVVTEAEVYAYLGLRFLMSVDRKPHVRDFWSTNRLRSVPIFPSTMPRDRFFALSHCLHFADNDGERPADDRLWKLRPVLDVLREQFRSVYVPTQHITVDESLWKFRGRLGFVTFNPTKRARFGVKVYKLSVSTGSGAGYTCALNIYTGQDRSELPASMKAVTDLMEVGGYFGKGYTMYVDNWYTSPTLFHYLQSRRTNAVGTARQTRKFMPKELMVGKARGDVVYRSTPTGMLCLVWTDKKPVWMLSTVHTSVMRDRGRNDRQGRPVVKPEVVIDYNMGMKGVDLSDQLAQSYPSPRKTVRWYRKMFFFLIDLAFVNAHRVHKLLGGSQNQHDYKLELVDELLTTYSPLLPRYSRSRPQANPVAAPRSEGRTRHNASEILLGRRRRCVVCYRRGKRKMTRSECVECGVPLCVYGCFGDYHSQE